MKRNVVSSPNSNHPQQHGRVDPGGSTAHASAAGRHTSSSPARRRRRMRREAERKANASRLGPKGWEAQLQGFINAHNRRHAKKLKNVSFGTMDDRATALFSAFKTLYRADPPLAVEPRNLADKHVRYLVNDWVTRGLRPGTIQVYMSYLRTFCEWINHPGMILPLENYVSDQAMVKRVCVAREDKSWPAHGVVPAEKLDEVRAYDARVACCLRLCLAEGMRVKEALMLRPHLAERDGQLFIARDIRAVKCETYLELKRGTKGGRVRWVPIDTPEKRAALEEAKALVKSETGHLGDSTRTLAQNLRHLRYVCEKFGITRADLGITPHGLRHQYAAERYEMFAGTPAPVRGGAPVARETDREARLRVANELGHARENITGAYLAGILKQPASNGASDAESQSGSPGPAVDPSMRDEKASCGREGPEDPLHEVSDAQPPAPRDVSG